MKYLNKKDWVEYIDSLKADNDKKILHLGKWNLLACLLFFPVGTLWGLALDSNVLGLISKIGFILSALVYLGRALMFLYKKEFSNLRNHLGAMLVLVALFLMYVGDIIFNFI